MYLSATEQEIANKKRKVIQNSDEHLECYRKCNNCNGTGLSGVQGFDGSYSWDGVSFCKYCNATGYIMFKNTIFLKKCPRCDGGGCAICNNKGTLDWIQYMRVGDKNG